MNETIRRVQTDILILGSGGAGLFAALHAHQAAPQLNISIAVKGLLGKCGCTRMVQGGYNVALAPGDSVERHFMDTIDGSKWLADQDLAWTLVSTAIERVRELENELGCFFDRNPDGSVHQKAFAGQTFDRTVHKGDLTGIEIINRLSEQVWARGIARLEEHRAVDLIKTPDGSALAGVLMIDMRTGGFTFVQAKAVLLATGGGPTMYKYHTPSGDKSCDGLAMALRAGLAVRDMEMVQFHPTGLLAGTGTRMTGTVLEEGLRGAGGYLLNGAQERFMAHYDERAERATRDIVSRSIFAEMRAGRTSPNGGVYLQMSHLGPDSVRAQFKGMVERCEDCGFDLAGGLVEVVPTAHYMMGGVVFSADCSTALPGLFAAGEDTGGVHGANRLGGNGVANSTVFGGIAGDTMAAWVPRHGQVRAPDEAALAAAVTTHLLPFAQAAITLKSATQSTLTEGAVAQGELTHFSSAQRALTHAPASVDTLREALFECMWEDVGILRTAQGLGRALVTLDTLEQQLARTGVPDGDRAFNISWHDWLNLKNLISVSRVIATSALAREDSRGAHFREDHPQTGSLPDSTYIVVTQERGQLRLSREPVRFTRVKPGQTILVEEVASSL
jgi:fumarate reductase flavoprotein subunit